MIHKVDRELRYSEGSDALTGKSCRLHPHPITLAAAYAAVAMGGALLAGTGSATAQEVVVYAGSGGSYQEAVKKAALEPLSEELGITIREETITGIADVKVQVDAGSVAIDIVEMTVGSCLLGDQQNLWEPLDYEVINTEGIDPDLVTPNWVGGLTYWSTVLSYNDRYSDDPPSTWADFWDVENFPGTRAMWNNPYKNIEIALLADGVTQEDLYPLDLERAISKLHEIAPHITVWYTSGAQGTQLLADGEIDMMPFWNGRVSVAKAEGAPIDFTFNQGLLASDCTVVPRGAPNRDRAMQVISRMLDPDIQSEIPQHIAYGPINENAFDTGRISPELAAELPSSPENRRVQITVDDSWWGVIENAERAQEMWTQMTQQ